MTRSRPVRSQCLIIWDLRWATYRNLEVDHLLGKRGHLIVEAECIFADALRGEDEISLAFLCSVEDDLAARCGHGVVDIERSAGLDLQRTRSVRSITELQIFPVIFQQLRTGVAQVDTQLHLPQSRRPTWRWSGQRLCRSMLSRWPRVCRSGQLL